MLYMLLAMEYGPGPGGFRWMSTVGDLSAMYDEIDPALACDKAEDLTPA